ncbi:hypothetical protein [Mycolicibacterium obuense]|uniref:hypothetical protein n=1 Tax=Mycolicibacterium obuense TaxID=1807 RepID=UPI000A876B57|nr:hypothetical protein [Mycolicibacterium obuense]
MADLLTLGQADGLVFPDSASGCMRGTNVRRRWCADASAEAKLVPRAVPDQDTSSRPGLDDRVIYDCKIHELRHSAAAPAIQTGANMEKPAKRFWGMSPQL